MKGILLQDFNKIIHALQFKLERQSRAFTVRRPFSIKRYVCPSDALYYTRGQKFFFLKEKERAASWEEVPEGHFLFIPKGCAISLGFKEPLAREVAREDLGKYMLTAQEVSADTCEAAVLFFSCKVFNALWLFSSLGVGPFMAPNSESLRAFFFDVFEELSGNHIGKERIIQTRIEHIVICLLRGLLDHNLFVQELATNSSNLANGRLIKICEYIRDNLKNDLSNRELSNVVDLSADYLGQYFKTLADINPQNYVEAQRMERAIQLLKNSDKKIHEIGREVGYRDNSYFCRRFKMMFGISASEMRRRRVLG